MKKLAKPTVTSPPLHVRSAGVASQAGLTAQAIDVLVVSRDVANELGSAERVGCLAKPLLVSEFAT